MSIDIYRSPAEFPADVEALFTAAEADRVAFGSRWYSNLIRSIWPDDPTVQFIVARRQGQPVAALPVLTTADGAVHSLTNYYTTLYAPLLRDASDASGLVPIVRHLLARSPRPATMQFGPMDPESAGFAGLRSALQACGLATFKYFAHGNWHLPVVCDWPQYLSERKGGVRSTIKRMEKRLRADGGHVEIIRGPEALERGIAAYEHVYARSWKKPEPFTEFIPGLIRLCSEQGWLRLGVVWLKGEAIAAQLWIVSGTRADIYKVAYDEAFKSLSPGTVLTAHLLQHVIEVDRVQEVDYLIGDDPYKAQWMTHRRERWGIVAYNRRSLRGLAGWIKESLGRRFKRWRGRRPTETAHAEP